MPNTNLTGINVTATQIRALRCEALEAGDYAQVGTCDRALTLDDDTVDQDGHLIALSEMSQKAARGLCADAISAARAAE